MRFILLFLKNLFIRYPKPFSCKNLDILVNGPSLKSDLKKYIKGNHKILVVNQFVKNNSFQSLRPDYYLIQDPYFWDINVKGHWSEKRESTIKLLNSDVNWDMLLILPNTAKNFFDKRIKNSNINISYFKEVPLPKYYKNKYSYNKLGRFLLDRNLISISNSNVLLTAIYIGLFSDSEHISVYGADMSFFKTLSVNQKNNRVGINEEHFYGDEFFEISNSKKVFKRTYLSNQLHKWAEIFREFERLSNYADKRGIKIFNKSSYSLIDSLKR